MSVIPLLVHLAEFITLLLIVLTAYKVFINYQAAIKSVQSTSGTVQPITQPTYQTTTYDADPIEPEVKSDNLSSNIKSPKGIANDSSKQKKETVLNDYIGDFF